MTSIYQVDAFTDRPFAGNPAAVCLLDELPISEPPSDSWLQHVATEMNLSETAFVRRAKDGFELRWMTPAFEVDLCGHATLAAAHVLWECNHVPPSAAISFFTRSGTLVANRLETGIELDFPQKPATPSAPPEALLSSLSVEPSQIRFVGRNDFDWLVDLGSADAVRGLNPDFRELVKLGPRGVIATGADSTGEFDFISRFFAPAAGVDEDPVTGSAHVCLGPYWQQRLGRDSLRGYQASPRGGIVGVSLAGDRALLSGSAVIVLAGELTC